MQLNKSIKLVDNDYRIIIISTGVKILIKGVKDGYVVRHREALG